MEYLNLFNSFVRYLQHCCFLLSRLTVKSKKKKDEMKISLVKEKYYTENLWNLFISSHSHPDKIFDGALLAWQKLLLKIHLLSMATCQHYIPCLVWTLFIFFKYDFGYIIKKLCAYKNPPMLINTSLAFFHSHAHSFWFKV